MLWGCYHLLSKLLCPLLVWLKHARLLLLLPNLLLLLLLTGLCASSLQLKQKVVSQPLHTTSSGSSGARSMQHSTAFSQLTPAAVQAV
jgi:hypothetical protein